MPSLTEDIGYLWSKYFHRYKLVAGRIFVVTVIVALVTLSISIYAYWTCGFDGDSCRPRDEFGGFSHLAVVNFISVLVGCILTVLLSHLLVKNNEQQAALLIFKQKRTTMRLLWSVIISVVIAISIFWITQISTGRDFTHIVFNNPGGLFAIITGIFSLVGLYLTLSAVLDIQNNILTFSDYISQYKELVDETPSDEMIFVCNHTPATGCMTLPERIWTDITDRMIGKRSIPGKKRAPVSMICLSDDHMKDWFEKFKLDLKIVNGDERAEKRLNDRIREGLEASKKVKDHLRSETDNPMLPSYIKDDDTIEGLIETDWRHIPNFYMIANSTKAIIAVPFFLPKISQVKTLGIHSERVEMIGFQTDNPRIVDAVHIELARLRAHIKSVQGD